MGKMKKQALSLKNKKTAQVESAKKVVGQSEARGRPSATVTDIKRTASSPGSNLGRKTNSQSGQSAIR